MHNYTTGPQLSGPQLHCTVALILNILPTVHDHHTPYIPYQPSFILITKVREVSMHEHRKLGVYGNLNISLDKKLCVFCLPNLSCYLYLFHYISMRKIIKLKNLVKLTGCMFPLLYSMPLFTPLNLSLQPFAAPNSHNDQKFQREQKIRFTYFQM